jgi:hypothetical protein
MGMVFLVRAFVPVVDKYQHFEISDYLKKKEIADALHTSGQIKFLEQKLVCSIGKSPYT